MWNKISQAAGLSAPDAETESAEEENVASEEHEQLQQQQLMVKQLKDLLRENEKRFQDKEKELQDIANKFQKFKLQSKAKISHLTNQLKENEKSAKKEDCDFDDTSSSDSSEQSQRGKLLFLKKQLGQVKQQLEKKDEELKKITESFETRVFDLETQLNEKNILISSLADKNIADKEQENVDKSPKRESNVQEMYAQIVYKDSKILELNNQILEHEKQIMDLQEHIKEKDEVLQQRNRAVQLMAEDLSRKGQTVVSELDETRDQMKIMQENFASTELEWRNELEKQKSRIVELEKEMLEQNKKLKNTELSAKNLESARYELSVKNAELQKKIVVVQESAAKQCEMYNKEIEGELENLKKSLEAEKKHSADLQVSLDEFNTQSENKVLKARVKERTKFKALERELNALKKSNEEKPKEILELQQHIAELEEDKGSLQLKIMDYEEQIILLDKIKDDNEKLSSDLKEALNKVEQYTKQITELEADNDAWKKKFQSLEENTNLLQEHLSRLSEEKHNLERKVMEKKQLERDYAILKSSHSEFENMYNETVMTLNELRDIKVSFELKNIELEEMRESDEKIRRELELQIHQLQDMLNNESKPDIQMQKEYLELKDLLQTVTQSLSFSENQIKQLSEEVEVLKSELNKKELEVNSCVKELEEKNNLLLSKEEIVGNLMSEVEKLADNVKSQTQHLSELNEIIVLRDTEISNLKSELQEKTSSELLLGEQINQFEERIQHFKSSNSEMENSFQEFNSQIIALQQSISRKDLYISELESSLQSRTVDLDALNQQLDDLHRTALDFDRLKVEQEKVVNQLKLQKQHNEELQHQILEKDNFVTKLQSELEDKSSSVSSLTLTTQKQSEKLEQLLKHQEGLTEELLSLKAKSVELTDMNSEKDDYILKLQSELQGKIATEISLTQTVQQQLDNLTQSLKQQESLSNELERLKNDQIAETEKVKSKMVSLLEQIEDLESELSRIQVDLDSKEKDLIAARSEIAQLQNEKTDLSRTFKETEDLLRKKSDLADKWELEYKNSQDEVDIVKKENDQLKCDLSERVVELSSLNQTISETKKCLVEKSDEVANLTAEFEIIKTDALNKEKTIKKLEEQNVILKQEVKHSNLSLSEKEEIYKKNMEEKLKFEANFLQLTEECELKDLTLKSKLEECELLNSKIDVLTKSIEVSENSAQNLSVELEHSQKEFLKLKTLSEEQLLDIQKKETEMLEMQKVIHELENEIIVQKEKLNNYVSTHEKQLTYSNELSNKLCLVESDLKQRDLEKEQLEQEYICLQKTFDDETNMKKELECQILNYKVEIEKISEERNHLEQKNAMYSDQISSFIAEIEKYKQQEADSNNSILCLNKLNAELTEKCNTFELAAKEFENQCKGLMEQINVLNQKCHQYEKSILEENEKALQELQVYKTLSDEQSLTIQKKEEDMVEKQNLVHQLEKEIIVQKEKLNNYVLTKKNMLFASVKELETKLSNCVEENEKLKCNNIQLQDVIKEKKLKRYQNETAESHVLESSHNVSNGLQVEIDNLRKELQLIEEQKSSLLQHLENSNSQLQLCVNEKIALEAVVEQMRKKFDDLIETNKNLSNSFEETQLVLKAKEESVNILENKLQVSTRAFEELCEELERLKSLQTDSQVRESQKITALERSVTSLKCTITDLWSTFSQIDSIRDFDFNLANLPPEFDKDSLKIITSFCSEIMRLKSLHDEEREKFQAYADECDIKNNELNEELQLLQSKLKNYETVGHSDEKSEEIQMKKDVILPVGVSQKLDKELLLQQNLDSMPVLPDYQKENESLKEEIHSLKLKSAKMLTKLKLFRDKTDKLSDDLKSAKDSNEEIRHLYNKSIKNEKDLQSVISLLKGENEMLLSKLQAMEAKQLQMVDKSNDIVSQLKERNMLLDEECSKLRKELQDYRYTWEQCSISYELQKEDNERLRTKLAQAAEEVELFKSKASELNLQLVQLEKENIHLRQETQNLQEHTKMLLSDNDTYQGLTERLTAAKSGLEQKIIDMKEKFVAEKAELEKKLDLKKSEVAETGIELRGLDELESENTSLKNLCEELKSDRQLIQRERDTYLKNKNLLEKEKLYLQQQLLEKVDEIDRINCQLQEAMSNRSQSNVQSVMDASLSGTDLIEQYEEKVNDLKEENRSLKSKLNSLTQELNLTNKKFEFLQNDIQNKESVYRDQISIAEKQLVASQQSSSSFDTKMQVPSNDANLQNELQQAMSSLHRQGLRCEELSVEVSRLLEERNNLQWRLQQCQQNTLQKSHESNLQSSECLTIEVESPSGTNFEMNQLSHSNIKLLQERRLQQSEKTCQELRRANEALDQALIHERDQKRQIEEELGYAQEHLNIEAKASDEYQILLGDLDEPELFAETNFSISRNVKTHAYKFRRWLNGRKNYLYRTIKGRKYPQLIYLFYIFFIHVWLLMCIF
ncbi:repetitive organellar protein-like [Uloborus diversus]|uniref:repetitive organellar protein-like n=1 Tax=Uloborus diversus TaxID=327109 RepID=UPI002409EB15|nr:repetitive organellar protein-like [Uloborus diversus]